MNGSEGLRGFKRRDGGAEDQYRMKGGTSTVEGNRSGTNGMDCMQEADRWVHDP